MLGSKFVSVLLLAAGLAATASAATSYSLRTTWKSTINDPNSATFTNVTFDTIPDGDYSQFGLLNVLPGLSFYGDSTNAGNLAVDSGVCASGCGNPTGSLLRQGVPNGYIDIVLPATVQAFGMDLVALVSSSGTFVDITYTSGGNNYSDTFLLIPKSPSTFFYGVIAAAPITNLRISNTYGNYGQLALDNFEVYQPASDAVPEPSALLLVGTGLLALSQAHRLRRPFKSPPPSERSGQSAPE